MVKEALFSILAQRIEGSACLDLFAGAGSLGIEALSRGAVSCVFCDSSPSSIAAVNENLSFVRESQGEGGRKKIKVIKHDFRTALRMLGARGQNIDIAFIDPPYDSGYYDEVMKTLLDYDIINDGGVVAIERQGGEPPRYIGFELIRHKRYGKTRIDIYERTSG
jgi:16S rRNA (guanine(966)-N(2))-methyltransferase RsmD